MELTVSVAKLSANPHRLPLRKWDGDSFDPEGVLRASASMRAFRVVLIKPSHYDAARYVIQWWRSTLPSNSLASVYGLVEECARDRVLGPDVDIDIETCHEFNTLVHVAGIARRIPSIGRGMDGLTGV